MRNHAKILHSNIKQHISKTYVLWGNKNKTRSFVHIILSIKDYFQQQFILMATSLGSNAVAVTSVHCKTKDVLIV